jgi:pentachlorophenol monooxygenase
MYHPPETEALIVGAGPIGLYTGISLAERGVPLRIIDEEWHTAARSYALALHPYTLTLLDEMDLADEVIARGHRVDRVVLYDGPERKLELDLTALRTTFPFVLVLPQSSFEDVLEERLKRTGGAVQWNHRLCGLTQGEDQIFAQIGRLGPDTHQAEDVSARWVVEETFQIHPRFLIGADGHHSTVRDLLGIPYDPLGPPLRFLVFEFDGAQEYRNEVRIVLHEDTASVLWPMPGNRLRWSIGLSRPDGRVDRRTKTRIAVPAGSEHTFEPTAQLFQELIEERAPWFELRPTELRWSKTVPFEPGMAANYGREHVWLAGDAAHQTGPIGVQGMNTALRETRDLVTRLEEILLDRASLDSLREYEEAHRREWRHLLGAEGPPVPGPEAPDWVRRHADKIVSCLPASGPELDSLTRQLGLDIRTPVSA